MNEAAIFDAQKWRLWVSFCGAPLVSGATGTMTSALTAFAIAVSGTSLICFVLMTSAERRRNSRRTSSDGSGTFAGDDSGSHFWSGFGGGHSASDSSSHSGGGATALVAATAGVTVAMAAKAAINDTRLAGNDAHSLMIIAAAF
jgi:hypothetical protein